MNNIKDLYQLDTSYDPKKLIEEFNNLLYFQSFLGVGDIDIGTKDNFKLVYEGSFKSGKLITVDYESLLKKKVLKTPETLDTAKHDTEVKKYETYKKILDSAFVLIKSSVEKPFIDGLVLHILKNHQRDELFSTGDVDFSVGRSWANYRINAAFQELDNGEVGITFTIRRLKKAPFSIEQMNINQSLLDRFNTSSGLILISGPTGSAKSSTLTTILAHINDTQYKKIVTLEDPVEFFWSGLQNKCTFRQREVGKTVESFSSGVRAAMRQAPDIIMVGEMRDHDTVQEAAEAAGTGHLVVSTVHVNSVRETLDRVLGFFEGPERADIAMKLSSSLKLVLNQRKVTLHDGSVTIAYEWLDCTEDGIGHLIKDNNLKDVQDKMYQTNMHGKSPHKPLNESLFELICEGKLPYSRAKEEYSNDVKRFDNEFETYIVRYSEEMGVSQDKLNNIILTIEDEYKERLKRDLQVKG